MTLPPKIRLAIVVVVLLAGLAFLTFAVFFNRGTLEISSEAPFSVNIVGLRSVNCEKSPCELALAPGQYTVEISKAEYVTADDQIQVSLGQKTSKSYQLQLKPRLLPQGPWNPDQLFSDDLPFQEKLMALSLATTATDWTVLANKISAALPLQFLEVNGEWLVLENQSGAKAINLKNEQSINLFAGVNYSFAPQSSVIYFLTDHPKTHLPALFKKDLNSTLSAESLINFVRTLKNPRLIINQEQTRLALIEQPDRQTSNLYLIDLQAKTRQIIDQAGLIKDVLWMPVSADQSQNFILEKINAETFESNLYLVNTQKPEEQILLPLKNKLSTVYPLDSDHLLLTEKFGSLADGTPGNGFNLMSFNLNDLQSQTIYSLSNFDLPSKIEYQSSSKTVLMLISNTVYSLSPLL